MGFVYDRSSNPALGEKLLKRFSIVRPRIELLHPREYDRRATAEFELCQGSPAPGPHQTKRTRSPPDDNRFRVAVRFGRHQPNLPKTVPGLTEQFVALSNPQHKRPPQTRFLILCQVVANRLSCYTSF